MYQFRLEVEQHRAQPPYHHVHHADVLRLLELGRLKLLEQIGFPNDMLIARDLFPVVVGLQIEYKREVLPGPATVTCEAGEFASRRLRIHQRLFGGDGRLAATALIDLMFMSGTRRRAVTPPADFVAAFLKGIAGDSISA